MDTAVCRAPLTQTSAAQADTEGAAQTAGDGGQSGSQWLSNLLRSEVYSSLSSLSTKPKTRQGTISFRFASATAGGGTATTPLATEPSAPTMLEYRDLADAALRRLTAPSPFLVWCLYTPTVHFVREAGSLLGPRTAATGSRSVLQHFLDDFTAETMLPRLMSEAKASAQAIISQKNAFAPATSVAMEGGTHVLQARPRAPSCIPRTHHLPRLYCAPLPNTHCRVSDRLPPGRTSSVSFMHGLRGPER